MAAATVISGMLYMLLWAPLVDHAPIWINGTDLWGVLRGAHYVGWGFLGGVYTPGTGVVTLPGMSVLLAPVAILIDKLNLSESIAPFFLAKPTAALVLQPVELLLSSTVVFGSDRLAERLGAAPRQRIVLCVAVAVLAWPVAAMWGHAEDTLALTLALYSLANALDGRWTRCAWLLGFGIAVQPLVALLIPLLVGASPAGRRLGVILRSMVLSVVLAGVAFAGNASDTFRALLKQPTPPSINHPTPWVYLSPHLATPHDAWHAVVKIGNHVFNNPPPAGANDLVAAGPGRTIYFLLAVIIGLYVWRRPQSDVRLIWLAASVLALRCFFEAVMTPYYLVPPLILLLVAVSVQNDRRFWASIAIAVESCIFAYHHLGPWSWWVPISVSIGTMMVMARPTQSSLLAKQERRKDDQDRSRANRDRRQTVDEVSHEGPGFVLAGVAPATERPCPTVE